MTHKPNIFTDFLRALDVPCTAACSADRYAGMPFQSMYGLMRLLRDYGVDSEAYRIADPQKMLSLTPPFLAGTAGGFVIVNGIDRAMRQVRYMSEGVCETAPADTFVKAWNGIVLLAYPGDKACEPDYALHARIEFFNRAKRWILAFAVLALTVYAVAVNGVYRHVSTVLLMLLDMLGLYFSFLLVQKSLNIHNPHADRVCGVLQEGGCDHVLETSASKFFGLFGWSEVGLAYFSVSLLALLMFPQTWGALALCNLCCLPFTAWSIWYQKFRAKAWCTLCVSVQCLLWLLFFCYLGGGWIRAGWPPAWHLTVLGFSYLAMLLGVNALTPYMKKPDNN